MEEQVNSKINSSDKMPLTKVDQILSRLKLATGASTDKEFAEFLGIDPQSTTSAKKRGEIPSVWLVRVAYRTNISIDWLLFGEGPMRRDEVPPSISPESCLNVGQYGMIPLLESWVTGGPEGEIMYEGIADHYPFKKWWLDELVGRTEERKKHLVLVRVRGDSMSPTINPGEMALVDTYEGERIEVRAGRIYLVVLPDGAVAIKRIVLSEKDGCFKLACLSDNTADYRPFEFEVERGKRLKEYILGRVRWVGKEFD